MRITASERPMLGSALRARQSVYQKSITAPVEKRPGLPVPAAPRPLASTRPEVAFLAQLIAKAEDMPVSRVKRRADPAEGAAAYRLMAGLARRDESRSVRVV
jgi:hypothetical protein